MVSGEEVTVAWCNGGGEGANVEVFEWCMSHCRGGVMEVVRESL